MAATSIYQLKMRASLEHLVILMLGLSIAVPNAPAKERTLQELQEQWTKRIAASQLPDASREQYEAKIAVVRELLAKTSIEQLDSYLHQSAAIGPSDEFHELLRSEMLKMCLAHSQGHSLIVALLATSPPSSMPFSQVEHFLALQQGSNGIDLLIQAAKQSPSDWAKDRILGMLKRAFPGLALRRSDPTTFLDACSLWIVENKAKVKVADIYHPMNPVTSGKRSDGTQAVPDCALFVPLPHSGQSAR